MKTNQDPRIARPEGSDPTLEALDADEARHTAARPEERRVVRMRTGIRAGLLGIDGTHN